MTQATSMDWNRRDFHAIIGGTITTLGSYPDALIRYEVPDPYGLSAIITISPYRRTVSASVMLVNVDEIAGVDAVDVESIQVVEHLDHEDGIARRIIVGPCGLAQGSVRSTYLSLRYIPIAGLSVYAQEEYERLRREHPIKRIL